MTAFKKPVGMTDEQAAVLESLAAMPQSEEALKVQEEMAFINLTAVLERGFKLDGLRAVLQFCEDAVNKAREVNEKCQENDELEMMDYRFAISLAIINEVTIPANQHMAQAEEAGGLKAMGISN